MAALIWLIAGAAAIAAELATLTFVLLYVAAGAFAASAAAALGADLVLQFVGTRTDQPRPVPGLLVVARR